MSTPRTRREREIWEACDVLLTNLNEVKAVTGEKIMSQLLELGYKKGCANEIYKYRRTWWALRGFTEEQAKGITNSQSTVQSFSDPIKRAVSIVQEELKTEANLEIEKIKETFEQQISELTEKTQQLEDLLDKTRLEREELSKEKDLVHQRVEAKSKEIEQLVKQNQEIEHNLSNKHQETEFLKQAHEDKVQDIKKHFSAVEAQQQEKISTLEKVYDDSISHMKTIMESNRHDFMLEKEKFKTDAKKLQAENIHLKVELEAMGEYKSKYIELEETHLELKSSFESMKEVEIVKAVEKAMKAINMQNNGLEILQRDMDKILDKLFKKEWRRAKALSPILENA